MGKIKGLDSIRAVAALWVFISHLGGYKDVIGQNLPGKLGMLVQYIYNAMFNGTAAVIVFFVISGFCIRISARADTIELGSFWTRRFVRVGGPMLAAVAISQLLFGSTALLDAVLWSLYCELIYYFLYPMLCYAAAKASWNALFGISLLAAVGLACLPDQHDGYVWAYGPALSWILGLPSWIAGVIIADKMLAPGWTPGFWQRRAWWAAMWILSSVTLFMHAHLLGAFKFTMIPFGMLAGAWLLWELRAAQTVPGSRLLEWIGTWSFSLYLVHKVAIGIVELSGLSFQSPLLRTGCIIVLAVGLSLAFFYAVERPFHKLARTLATRSPRIYTVSFAGR